MNYSELCKIFDNAPETKMTVVGDFCLDKYLYIDSSLDEPSVETGLAAYQVVKKKMFAGAAGTVVNNLRSLGASVSCIGVIGTDGEGCELLKALENIGALTHGMITDPDRVTPTYIKPMRGTNGVYTESNRLDIKNFTPMNSETEKKLISEIYDAAETSKALVVLDQYLEPDCGVINTHVREAICEIAKSKPELVVYADSRAFIHKFRNVILKCNNFETVKAVKPEFSGEADEKTVIECGIELYKRNGRAVFVTQGSSGMTVIDESVKKVQGLKVEGPFDICGAGDSATAGITLALASGESSADAALLGNIVASITVQQIGVTGSAAPEQVKERYNNYF